MVGAEQFNQVCRISYLMNSNVMIYQNSLLYFKKQKLYFWVPYSTMNLAINKSHTNSLAGNFSHYS